MEGGLSGYHGVLVLKSVVEEGAGVAPVHVLIPRQHMEAWIVQAV